MNRPPTHASTASGLTRRSSDLTPAHRELIKLLAEIAVEDYLREIEAGTDSRGEPAQPWQEEIIQ